MAERFPRNAPESNPVILVLARVAAALEERERAEERASAEAGEIPQEGAEEVGGDVATDAH